MALVCSVCRRENPTESAIFCMFCGQRLAKDDATLDYLPAVEETAHDSGRSAATADVPERIGGYRILRYLGAGGMGQVYEAAREDTGKRVALKLLAPNLAANATSVERFRQEGRLASQLTHPRCVFVYHADADSLDSRPFIAMELMPGKTLKDLVEQNGPLPPDEAIQRILDVIDGLIEAHRLGLIHRDVKPSNCFLTTDNRVKIGDFGLSKSLIANGDEGQLTRTGAFLGTVFYAPPEQICGEEVSYDSDVYSVCATLFFLLTGRAPYQHESITVSMARAISERPPRVRHWRPDVPAVLDRVIRKGLERDRRWRYQNLEELRDALRPLLPEEQAPARTRMLIAAYIVDFLLLIFLVRLPVEFLEWLLSKTSWLRGQDFIIDPFASLGYILYFAVLEGFFGFTFGKWLLGMRVVPHGSVGPPGFGVATLRSTLFHAGWMLCTIGLYGISEWPGVGAALGVLVFLTGLGLLAYRRRRASSNRGLHDWFTGTHVIVLPRPPHRPRLQSQYPNRFDTALKVPELPERLTGYTIRGRFISLGPDHQVWTADDRSLNRRVFIHLRAGSALVPPPIRGARLRNLGSGVVEWQGRQWHWNALAAPAGAPLLDMVDPDKPLNWPDARMLLEQLVEELQLAQAEHTLPEQLSLNHLWCEPSGRLVLMEFRCPAAKRHGDVQQPLDLARQTARLLLEGELRRNDKPVAAPLPTHASAIMHRLCDRRDGYTTVEDLSCELQASHAFEPEVTRRLRASQLGIAATMAAVPLLLMFLCTQFIGFFTAIQLLDERSNLTSVLEQFESSNVQPIVNTHSLARASSPEAIRARLQDHRERLDEGFMAELHHLTRPERYLLVKYRDREEITRRRAESLSPAMISATIQNALDSSVDASMSHQRRAIFLLGVLVCLFFLCVWIVIAFVFRCGAAYLIPHVTLVDSHGRKAGRFRCAARELILWMPLIAVLLLAAWVQLQWPSWLAARLAASGTAVITIFAYLALGIMHPIQGPLDRLFNVWRVPV